MGGLVGLKMTLRHSQFQFLFPLPEVVERVLKALIVSLDVQEYEVDLQLELTQSVSRFVNPSRTGRNCLQVVMLLKTVFVNPKTLDC